MTYTLIIAEKPQAAKRIAESLADDKPKKIEKRGAYYYEFERNGRKHLCVPAVGHLFVLNEIKKGKGWSYPIFSYEWTPTFKRRGMTWVKKYYENIQELAEKADEFVDAADYDTEGEVLLYNILRFLCDVKDAKRMVFSTLTKDELIESYDNARPHISFDVLEAGLTRHELDFLWGLNTTRAMTLAMKKHFRGFQVISSGRVQSPTLSILNKKEKEIKKFIPVPFWQIQTYCKYDKTKFLASYEKDQIWKKPEADKIVKDCKGKKAEVKDIQKRIYKQKPPVPFNTTTLQTEVYNQFKYSPRQTMSYAEALYQAGLISYPRTASQKLSEKINYVKILKSLKVMRGLGKILDKILAKKQIKPTEGKKEDKAHPAIYPTGEIPKKITAQQKKLYELIVRRFLACFGDEATKESIKIILDINGHKFSIAGRRILEKGWTEFYEKFLKYEEQILPEMQKGEKLDMEKIDLLDKETQPPSRFSQGSIVKEMEELGLGTRATRAQILQTLYDRGYIVDKSIRVTQLGETVVDVLQKYCPDLLSEELTKHFEKEMEDVMENKKKRGEIVEEAKKILDKTLKKFKKNEEKIGKELIKSFIKYKRKQKSIGICPKCGKELRIIKSRRTGKRFVGCTGYKDGCRYGQPLPQRGMITPTNKFCKECGSPMIIVKIFSKRPFTSCINIDCPTKDKYKKKKAEQEKKKKAQKKEESKKEVQKKK